MVLATGYETQLQLRQSSVQLASTYAIATDAVDIPDWLDAAILWDTDSPYHYARAVDHRMLIGGGDEPFVDEYARDALMPDKSAGLLQYLLDLFPWMSTRVSASWCGTFARTADSLPYIGSRAGSPDVFYTLGYGGNGITAGMLGAMCLRDEMMGRPCNDVSLFSFERDRPPYLG